MSAKKGNPQCHPERKYHSNGLCKSCYFRVHNFAYRTDKEFSAVKRDVLNFLAITPERCEICGTTEDLTLDHCHKTNKLRGLICRRHNTAIAFLGEDWNTMHDAIRYLLRHGAFNE